jgi:hypothetical protein
MSMSHEQIRQRYPRLLRAMIWVAIQGYQEGREYTSEAVGHFGGASRVIHEACSWQARKFVVGRHLVCIDGTPEA